VGRRGGTPYEAAVSWSAGLDKGFTPQYGTAVRVSSVISILVTTSTVGLQHNGYQTSQKRSLITNARTY